MARKRGMQYIPYDYEAAYNRDKYPICGGRNGVSSPRLPPLFLFGGILVFCLSVPDNMSRIRSVAKE